MERFELRTRYPFGWFRAWTYVHTPLTAFVAPRPGGERALPSAAAAAGTTAQSEARGDEDFAGLRAYEAGVPLKHMAWKVLARGGEPAVRSYTGLAAQPEWLDWTTLRPAQGRSPSVATVPLGARQRGRAASRMACEFPEPRSRRRAARGTASLACARWRVSVGVCRVSVQPAA